LKRIAVTFILVFSILMQLTGPVEAWHGRIESISNTINDVVVMPNDIIVFVRDSGYVTITDKQLNFISNTRWAHGSYAILAAALRPDGSVVIAGASGRWQIINSNGSFGQSGTWSHGSNNINAIAVRSDGTSLLAGANGRCQFLSASNSLLNSFTALSTSHIYTATARKDDSIVIAGYNGRYQTVKPDNSLSSVNQWGHSTNQIRTSLLLPNGNVLLAGDGGRIQILTSSDTLSTTRTWSHGSYPITSSHLLDNGQVIIAGRYGAYQLLDQDLNLGSHSQWPNGTSSSYYIYGIDSLSNDSVIMGGYSGYVYLTPTLSLKYISSVATSTSITLNWAGMNESQIQYHLSVSQTGNFDQDGQVLLNWVSQTSYQLSSLQPDTVYYFRLKARNPVGIENNSILEFSVATGKKKSIVIDGTTYNYEVGNGADGDVEFRLNPNNSSQAQMLVNGQVVATSSNSYTIRGNIFQNYTSQMTVRYFDIEDIIQYLPACRTYSPSKFYNEPGATAPAINNVPNFRNLTIREGVMLRARSGALAFKVQENLIVEGVLATAHGSGGTGGTSSSRNGTNGGDAAGDIVIYASSISVAPNGTNASKGAIMAGWGGGGGGAYGNGTPGNGGRGGSIIIYADNINMRGEIRAGNGGGGGGAGCSTDRVPGGSGGRGGFLTIYAGNITSYSNATFAAGYGGGGGGGGGRNSYEDSWDDMYYYYGGGGGGYGGGGGGTYQSNSAGNGGSAGDSGNPPLPRPEYGEPGYGNYNEVGVGGGAGRGGNGGAGGAVSAYTYSRVWHTCGGNGGGAGGAGRDGRTGDSKNDPNYQGAGGPGGANGSLTIGVADSFTGEPNIIIGYLSGGDGYQRGSESRTIITGNTLTGAFYSAVTSSTSLKCKDIVIRNTSDINSINVSGNAQVKGGTVKIRNGNIAGDLNMTGGTFQDTTLTIGANAYLKGSYSGNVNLTVSGDTRFQGNTNYRTDSWWMASNRIVRVNGLRIRGVTPVASPNPVGAIEISLGDWVGKYNEPQGTMPSMAFRIDRKIDGELEWTPSTPILRSLVGAPSWTDTRTVIGKEAVYSVGFKLPDSQLGFIFLDENATAPVISEGGGIDEVPPTINYFSVANDRRTVNEPLVSVRLSAQDNRTETNRLSIQVTVNDQPYYYDEGQKAFIAGNQWTPYIEKMENLPLKPGENEVVLKVRDESFNIGSSIRFVYYLVEDGDQNELTLPGGSNDWALPGSGIVKVYTPEEDANFAYVGNMPAYFIKSERAIIEFANIPENISFVQVSLDNLTWSEHIPIDKPVQFNVRPDSFAPLSIRFANENLVSGPTHELLVIYKRTTPRVTAEIPGNITATRNSTITIKLHIEDIYEHGHKYSLDNGQTWHNVPSSREITANLTSAYNILPIQVMDIAGNVTEAKISVWRL
jgi:hypothetical protein